MRGMLDPFTRHPHAVGETYGEHLATAAAFGLTMIVAGLACLVHALAPFLFEHTASGCVERLHERMRARVLRDRSPALPASLPGQAHPA